MSDRSCGVYQILNTRTGKRYVGGSTNLKRRFRDHRWRLNTGCHHSKPLQRAWDKHGDAAFKFEVLEACPPEELTQLEQSYIDRFNAADAQCGYNTCPRADSSLGRIATAEERAHMSATRKGKPGRKQSPATRRRISRANLGNPSRTGQTLSDETKRKISKAKRGKATMQHTEESREKIRQAKLGTKHSKETRKKMSQSQRNRYARERAQEVRNEA